MSPRNEKAPLSQKGGLGGFYTYTYTYTYTPSETTASLMRKPNVGGSRGGDAARRENGAGEIPPTPLLRKGGFLGLAPTPGACHMPALAGAERFSLTQPSPAGRGLFVGRRRTPRRRNAAPQFVIRNYLVSRPAPGPRWCGGGWRGCRRWRRGRLPGIAGRRRGGFPGRRAPAPACRRRPPGLASLR